MARRFGGRYSPDARGTAPAPGARGAYEGAQPDPAGMRVNLLTLPPIVLLLTSLTSGAIGLVTGLVGAAALGLAAWLLREGLRAEAAYHARKVARRPAMPRKMAASLLTGIGVAFAAYRNEPGLAAPLLYGLAAGGLHVAAFGIDPLRHKGIDGVDSFQQDRVARAVDEAESYLKAMRAAIQELGDRVLTGRIEAFQATARDLIRAVEEDPRDLTGVRRYLTVYLMGARDAAMKYADLARRRPDRQAREDFIALLGDLEENFAARTRRMLTDDRSDLSVEIEVLRDRLQREGVRSE